MEYLRELEQFFKFWKNIMDDFEKVKEEEIAQVIRKNKELSGEMKEILEKTTGFEAPPNSEFLQLLAVKKIATKLKTNDAVKYLNFDYFKRKNKELNEDWVKRRKDTLEKKIKKFEEMLEKNTELIKNRIDSEVAKLHAKRQKQFNMLNIKYNKCKMLIDSINAQESIQQKQNKRKFLLRNDVPKSKFNEQELLADMGMITPSINKIGQKMNEDDIMINDDQSQRTITKKMKSKFITN